LADEREEARLSGKDADTVRISDASRYRPTASARHDRADGETETPPPGGPLRADSSTFGRDEAGRRDEPAPERWFAGRGTRPGREATGPNGAHRRDTGGSNGGAHRRDTGGSNGGAHRRDTGGSNGAYRRDTGTPKGSYRRDTVDRGERDDGVGYGRVDADGPAVGRRHSNPPGPGRADRPRGDGTERRAARRDDEGFGPSRPYARTPDTGGAAGRRATSGRELTPPGPRLEPTPPGPRREPTSPGPRREPTPPGPGRGDRPTTPVPRGVRPGTGPTGRREVVPQRPSPRFALPPAARDGRDEPGGGPRGGVGLLDRGATPTSYAIGPGDADTTGAFLAPIVHSPGLDGLRALAVLAVIAYHAGIPWVRGGLLGVDTFFVLSGFLITGLLVAEYRATRRIDLKDFWSRRFRRLLPAALLLLLAVAAYARFLAAPSDVGKIRLDILATLFYVANWRFALSGQSYFDHFSAPSPLLHTWSLAVEEQFYVLWPLVIFLLMRHSARTADRWRAQRRKAQSAALAVAVLGAEASALTGLVLLLAGVDASKIYYGTEVRVQALLTGAALAVWRAQRRNGFGARGKKVLGHAGGLALLAMFALWGTVDGQARGLYAGGFLGLAVIVGVLVAAIVEVPSSPVAKVLSIRPLTYIGKISYGLYLWHWPILQALTASRTGLHGSTLLGARMAATAACTLVSFYLVENPIRRRKVRFPKPLVTVPAVVAAVVAISVVATSTTASHARSAGDLDKLASRVEGTNGVLPTGAQAATAGPPLKMLVAGDSLATTLVGSQFTTVAATMNMQVADASMLGCGVARLPERRLDGVAGPTTFGCDQWPARFTRRVNEVNPDVTVLLVGRWEVTDQLLNGVWTHVGEPDFDAYLATQLDLAITTLSGRGAKVVLFTTPAVAAREGPDGTQYPETNSDRVAAFNKVLQAAATRHPGVASIADLNAVLTPGNRFTDHIDGILTRDDGVHITAAGGRIVGQALLPTIVQMVRQTRTDRTPVVTATSPG
jgi:peptidoglycan/LPS O-acetylase OafA/YrhL